MRISLIIICNATLSHSSSSMATVVLIALLIAGILLGNTGQGKYMVIEVGDESYLIHANDKPVMVDRALGGAVGGPSFDQSQYAAKPLADDAGGGGNGGEDAPAVGGDEVADAAAEPGSDYNADDADPPANCSTIGGPTPGKQCIFPFFFTGTNQTYKECTRDMPDGTAANEYWCSTLLNAEGEHQSGQWGTCGPACPGVKAIGQSKCPSKQGHECFFPYTFEGFSYRGCIEMDGAPSCFARDKDDKVTVKKDECTPECISKFKDTKLTEVDQTMEQILGSLMKTPDIFTVIKRGNKCATMLEEKFAKEDKSKFPAVAQKAKNFLEALKLVCEGSEYCTKPGLNAYKKKKVCGSYYVELRKNVEKDEETGQTYKQMTDCMVQCGNPE